MFTSSSDLQEKLRESLLIRYKNLGPNGTYGVLLWPAHSLHA